MLKKKKNTDNDKYEESKTKQKKWRNNLSYKLSLRSDI